MKFHKLVRNPPSIKTRLKQTSSEEVCLFVEDFTIKSIFHQEVFLCRK